VTRATLLTMAHRMVRDERLLSRGELVLAACSGGADSTALLHALALLRKRVGHRLAAVGIDHGLRAAAPAELDGVEALARSLDVPFARVGMAVRAGGNLQARARAARHQALQAEAARCGAVAVALGHTADDRAETFLLRLLRGAGPRGLAVMPPRAAPPVGNVALVRPLLAARRADVLEHNRRHGLSWTEDPSNADARFLRVRVRRELVPLLEQLAPGIVEHLGHLATMLGSDGNVVPGLNRAQQLALARAVKLRRGGAKVRLRGGRDLRLLFVDGTPVLSNDE
jgi:tRNA(Ile)-lysidine synthase